MPIESLLGVLENALKISGLALIDTDVPGWKKIVKVEGSYTAKYLKEKLKSEKSRKGRSRLS